MKLISVTSNQPVPRGGFFQEVRKYQQENGSIRIKTINIPYFRGRYRNWDEYVNKQPFDDEKMKIK